MGPTVSARTLIFWAENIRELDLFRGYGSSIRPVYDESMTPIPVEGVSLDQSSIEISIGRTATLTATVLPRSATNKSVTWSSSDESVATVSSTGVVKGISIGTATITATAVDGGKTANCSVTVIESPPGETLFTRAYDGKTYSILRNDVSSTEYRANGDGSRFYTCSYSIQAADQTYDLPGTYYTHDDNRNFKDVGPALAVDTSTGTLWAFLIEKDTDEYYGMCGYMFKISNGSVSRQTVFTASNFGWFPYFTWEDTQLALNCFSFAGYFGIIAFENEDWVLNYAGDIYPEDFKAKQDSHEIIFIH